MILKLNFIDVVDDNVPAYQGNMNNNPYMNNEEGAALSHQEGAFHQGSAVYDADRGSTSSMNSFSMANNQGNDLNTADL